METESLNRKIKESLEHFEYLPDMQPSGTWNETLNRRLHASPRKHKTRPLLVLAIISLVVINGGVVLKTVLSGSTASSQDSQKLELIAETILFNPDSANN